MCLFARHSGWLNATPKDSDKPHRDIYLEGSPYLEMTPLSDYEQHLIELWTECGTIKQTSGGITPLEWPDITSWASRFYTQQSIEMVEHPRHSRRHKRVYTPLLVDECTLTDWELLIIRKLSQEYSSEYSQASGQNRECPKKVIIEDVCEDAAIANAKAIADAFKSMFVNGDASTSNDKIK